MAVGSALVLTGMLKGLNHSSQEPSRSTVQQWEHGGKDFGLASGYLVDVLRCWREGAR